MKTFNINESSIDSITVKTVIPLYHDNDVLNEEELLEVLSGSGKITTIGTEDHPEFKQLRNQLESEGFITTQRNCWNGDRVIKSFYLNEWKFKKGDRFPSGGALGVSIKVARKHNRKTL